MTIHLHPSALVARWELPGGEIATVRPIRPEDADLEASFVRNLSDDARHSRFMFGLRELPRDLLIRLTRIDHARELALVVLVERDGADAEIAVARYATTADGRGAEVAIVVADAWQRKGIGTRLFAMLIDHARARGLDRLQGEMLAENAAVRALVAKFGFSVRLNPENGATCLVEKKLA